MLVAVARGWQKRTHADMVFWLGVGVHLCRHVRARESESDESRACTRALLYLHMPKYGSISSYSVALKQLSIVQSSEFRVRVQLLAASCQLLVWGLG